MPYNVGDAVELAPGIAKEVESPGPETIEQDPPHHYWVPEHFEVLENELKQGSPPAPPDQPPGPPWTNGKLIYTAGLPGKVKEVLPGGRYRVTIYWPVLI